MLFFRMDIAVDCIGEIRIGIALMVKGEKMIDYEGMILAKQEEIEIREDMGCDGECDHCPYKRTVPGTDERIDREPAYYCSLFERY